MFPRLRLRSFNVAAWQGAGQTCTVSALVMSRYVLAPQHPASLLRRNVFFFGLGAWQLR